MSRTAPQTAATALRPEDPSVRSPRVLILLATYNGCGWIHQQLRSVLLQHGVNVTVVARDDGSTDATRAELLRFQADPRVQLILDTRRTGSAAASFLRLIEHCASDGFDFVALADQDDIWYEHKLLRACKMIRSRSAAGYSSATLAQWKGHAAIIPLSANQNPSDFLFEGAGQGCTFVMTSTFYERARTFLAAHRELTKALHFHDWALYALARSWGLAWTFDPEPSMVYRQHGGNDTGARGSYHGAMRRLTLIRNGWYRKQLATMCELCIAAEPGSQVISAWHAIFSQTPGLRRKLRLIRFFLHGGRRRLRDNVVVMLAAALGWL